MSRIACIIPAYREAARIGAVVDAALGCAAIDEIVVVDDGSPDETAKAAYRNDPRLRIISHTSNRGKTAALATGFHETTGETIVLLDADLVGITSHDIARLITPVTTGIADITISLRGNAVPQFKLIGLDYLSGERCFARSHIADALTDLDSLPRFGFEVFLNERVIAQKMRIAVVRFPSVQSPYKYRKVGWLRGLQEDVRMTRDILTVVSITQTLRQIAVMRYRLTVPKP